MSDSGFHDFVGQMKTHCAMPSHAIDDASAFFRGYFEALGEYPDATLKQAAKDILKQHDARKGWPSIPDCVKACERAIQKQEAGETRRTKSGRALTTDEMRAEREHLGRLSTLHEEGETERAARLLVILAVRSGGTHGYDFGMVNAEVRRLAVDAYRAPRWLLGGKR